MMVWSNVLEYNDQYQSGTITTLCKHKGESTNKELLAEKPTNAKYPKTLQPAKPFKKKHELARQYDDMQKTKCTT